MPSRQETAVCTCATRQTVAKFCKKPFERKVKLLSSVPSSFATRAEVVEADPACPRGPLSNSISKQNPEHVTHATHPLSVVLPSADRGIKQARQRGTPAWLSAHARTPTHSLPGHARLGFECLLASDLASGNPVTARRSHGDELPPCPIHPTAITLQNEPRITSRRPASGARTHPGRAVR